jgi:hypothetical protein
MTVPGELARVTGLTRPEAGLGNKSLVEEGYAVKVAHGTYRLAALEVIHSRMRPNLLRDEVPIDPRHLYADYPI